MTTTKAKKRQDRDRMPACEFTIDPQTPQFKNLRSVCEPGSPYRCLIATTGSIQIGKRMTVRLDHARSEGVIGITHGDARYERPMTREEVEFATKFDLGRRMRKPLTVRIDLYDGTWKAKPKEGGRGTSRAARRRSPRAATAIGRPGTSAPAN